MLIDNGKKIAYVQGEFKSCHLVENFTCNSDVILRKRLLVY